MHVPARRLAVVPIAALAVLTAVPTQAHAADAALSAKLASVLRDPRVTASRNGTLVVDAASGSDLHIRNSALSLMPASNMKLVTSAASLRTLGASYTFKTEAIARAGKRADGSVPSSVYLKGYGDPTVLDTDLRALAQNLRGRGVTRFTGNLVADASFFDSVRYNPGWSSDDASEYYAPQISGLTMAPNADFDAGTIIVNTYRNGSGTKLTVSPSTATGYVRLVNKVKQGSATSIKASRAAGTNTITVTGTIARTATTGAKKWVTVNRPDLLAAHVFRAELARAGISVAGGTVSGTTPSTSRVIVATDYSPALSTVTRSFLKLSNNAIGEHLIKTMGARSGGAGTTAKGAAYLRSTLTAAKAPLSGVVIQDGSGLSRANRMTPRALTRVLRYAQTQPWSSTYRSALPLAGNPDRMTGGTLRTRMVGTAAANKVSAKTGSLTGVTALSGYAQGADGRQYIFSMLSTYSRTSPRPVEDRVAITLASHRR
ncbi:D-alanyl-D-alanine carboxypeptidase/D-alanyl-D-alanine endopeptidase [Nigerium massiliense]|uniref:D-alanyl-D-alanine carboxypeptidase/D-alanyl-D-alanine endopeptidase n=1 Tax=Nigerium massiliense TaxID=1522317 RepID=UPI0006933447|nr:D-alanyl-D-alanine carboxypeptidase/D-alanyl-D-alanine-endopeptidase [Nigerium massiliense]